MTSPYREPAEEPVPEDKKKIPWLCRLNLHRYDMLPPVPWRELYITEMCRRCGKVKTSVLV